MDNLKFSESHTVTRDHVSKKQERWVHVRDWQVKFTTVTVAMTTCCSGQ